VLETRRNGSTNAYEQYVWDLRYIDAPILRYRDANGHTTSTATGDGTLEETLYVTYDANFNVTGLAQENQTFVERYVYTPYGDRTVLTGTFGSRASTSYDQQLGHQGLRIDAESGTYYNRARQLHSGLGSFTARDPKLTEYQDGMSLYGFVEQNPVNYVDPFGLESAVSPTTKPTTQPTVPPSQVPPNFYPPAPCPADNAADCGVSYRQRPETGGHAWVEINFGVAGYLPLGAGWWPGGMNTWTPVSKTQPIKATGNSGGKGPQTGWGDPLTGNGPGNVGNAASHAGVGPTVTALIRNNKDKLGAGPKAGTPCVTVTCRDIWDCLASYVQPGKHGVLLNNCRDGAEDGLHACCLNYA
jgi:RHS repeat-associated protein